MIESPAILTNLRKIVAKQANSARSSRLYHVPLGISEIDSRLGGGLIAGRLHELYADSSDDASSAAGFAAMLALCLCRRGGRIVWLRQDDALRRIGRVDAHGLSELGIDPARLIFGHLPDCATLLRVAVELLRCDDVGCVVIELWRMPRQLDLTASRRLALAAEQSGVTPLLLRAEAEPTPSAAQTRWRIASAAGVPLEANAPGHPTLDLHLVRQRGGMADARWRVEWDRDQAVFREPNSQARAFGQRDPLFSGAVVPLSSGRTADPQPRRATG